MPRRRSKTTREKRINRDGNGNHRNKIAVILDCESMEAGERDERREKESQSGKEDGLVNE